MRRAELEKRLRAFGWTPTGQLYVPDYDLIPDAVGERILEDAEG